MDYNELISGLKNGSSECFNYIFKNYGVKIYNLALRMTGNKEDAEDITQETLIKVYRNIDKFKGNSHIYTWIYAITKNNCLRHLEKINKVSFSSLEYLIDNVQSKSTYQDPEKAFYISQVKEGCLMGLVRSLPFYQRLAFILVILFKISVRDTAAIIGKNENTVRILIHRARMNIKNFLCRNCSLYDKKNSCKCENLINFSMKQGWIKKYKIKSKNKKERIISIETLEDELNHIKKITDLYLKIPEKMPSNLINKKIYDSIKKEKFFIFSSKKVK